MSEAGKPIIPLHEMMPDEQHMAAALYLLGKAVAIRQHSNSGWPMIHAALRDASMHLEEARKCWTKEAILEQNKASMELFGEALYEVKEPLP